MSAELPDPLPAVPPAPPFRWQALFQHTADPLFVLDRRRRLAFVNAAWVALTGVAADEARGLPCRRRRPAAPGDDPEDVLAHALTPPPEVLAGAPGRARRLCPARPGAAPAWWDVDFFPLRQGGSQEGFFILGAVRPLPPGEAPAAAPLPERLAALRERAVRRWDPDLRASAVPAVRTLAEQVRVAGEVAAPVWLVGGPGAGKQTLARAVHYAGPARERPFAALDCARLPAAVVAHVLFDDPGPASPSGLGGVYLREPAALPRDVQAKLAEWLAAERPGRPRLFAGAAARPEAEARAGRLVEDLACRLGALVFEVPPLRERRADLPRLVERLLGEVKLTEAAWEVVRAYPWPGNLRELAVALTAAAARAGGGSVDAAHLPAHLRLAVGMGPTPGPARPLPLGLLLEQAERRLIELALRRCRGNKSRAAELLGVWRPKLIRRMEALGLSGPPPELPDESEPEA